MADTFTLNDDQRDGPWDELIGRNAGSYRIVRLLGKGGMGAVYLARHPGIGSQVAVKFLHPRLVGDRAHVERFFNEARAVNLIGHENIVKTMDFSMTPDGRYYFVMEHLTGAPLSSLQAPVPLAVAGPILLQCCRALQAAHQRQIVHRDLKPDNVFLISQMGKKNFVKLVDFGIAKLLPAEGAAAMTEAGALIGTPEYMSPEQAAGRGAEVGRRSDVYSLGVVMYQLAAGRVPFKGESTAQTLVAQMQERPRPPRELEPSVPEQYEKVILKALEKRKEDRWQSMAELHDAILGCMKELGVSTELPAADAEPPQPPQALPPTDPPDSRVPPTQTFSGDRAPVQARVERFADWALAPPRRLRTLGALLASVALIVLLVPSRKQQPPPAPAAKPIASPRVPPAPVVPAPAARKPAEAVPPAPSLPEQKSRKRKPEPAKKPAAPAAASPQPQAPAGPQTAAAAARLAARPKERETAAAAVAQMTAAAAQAAREDAAARRPPAGVKLFVVSDPLGAAVTASWSGKSAAGRTPIVFRVRRGATVTVSVSRPGYASVVREVVATEAQAVSVELRPGP